MALNLINRIYGLFRRRETPLVNPEGTRIFFMSPRLLLESVGDKIAHPYKQHVWVYAAVNAIAQNIANVPLLFYTGTRKNKVLIEDHDLVKLFESPNPMMSGSMIHEATFIQLGLAGEACCILDRDNPGDIPREIWTFPASRFEHVPDPKTGLIAGWIYRKGPKKIPLADYQVLFLRYYNPYDDYRGLSPLAASRDAINQDWYASKYNTAFFQNGALPAGVIQVKESLSLQAFNRMLAQWNDRHQGASKAHKIALLEEGAEFKATGLTHKDMDWLEGRKWHREEILAAYKVPKGEVGLFEDDKYANSRTQRKLFWTNTLMPKMGMYEFELWNQILKNIQGGRIWAEFDYQSIEALQDEWQQRFDLAYKSWQMGVPFNQVNERFDLGFEEIEGGDIGYLPFNLVPASQVGQNQDKSPSSADDTGKALVNEIAGYIPAHAAKAPLVQLSRKIDPQKYWQNYIALHGPIEDRIKSKIKRYFYEQRRDQLQLIEERYQRAILRDALANHLLIDLDEANKVLRATMQPMYFFAAQEFGGALVGELGMDPEIFNLVDSGAIAELQTKVLKIVRINDTVREQVRATLSEGIGQMESTAQLQDRVRTVYNFATTRSLTIARTETGQAAGIARDAAMGQVGVEKIGWVTAGDEHVRPSHANLGGQVIKRGETFGNGLRYPCDPNGPAKEIINCRCCAIPVLD